jgi:hypothetical protein
MKGTLYEGGARRIIQAIHTTIDFVVTASIARVLPKSYAFDMHSVALEPNYTKQGMKVGKCSCAVDGRDKLVLMVEGWLGLVTRRLWYTRAMHVRWRDWLIAWPAERRMWYAVRPIFFTLDHWNRLRCVVGG